MTSSWSHHEIKGKYEGDPNKYPIASGDFMKEDIYTYGQQQKILSSLIFSLEAQAQKGEYEYAIVKYPEVIK